MEKIANQTLTGERALFNKKDIVVTDCVFEDGESPLKECENVQVERCDFKWKYPFWYGTNVTVKNSTLFDMARAGVWYTKNVSFKDCLIIAPKIFRRADGVCLENVEFTNASETLWNCKNVTLKNVKAKGDYFAMNCENVEIENFELDGNYCFDGAKNVTVKNAKMMSKDSFWNCKDITVCDSHICGEYFGWNSENITLVNCTIESLQGFCYIKNLKLVNCKLPNTTLSFEYCTVDADVIGKIESVKNPISGRICCDEIDELIMEEDKVDVTKTQIICKGSNK